MFLLHVPQKIVKPTLLLQAEPAFYERVARKIMLVDLLLLAFLDALRIILLTSRQFANL